MKFAALPRLVLKTWARSGVAPGPCYAAVESFGAKLGGTLPSRLPGGSEMLCDLKDHVQRQIFYWGAYELLEVYVFHHLLKCGMNFVDAGANVGQYSVLAASVIGAEGRAFAFEPMEQNHARLRDTLKRNGITNVEVVERALWHENRILTMGRESRHSDNAGTFRVTGTEAGVAVQACPFDEWALDNRVNRVDIVKVDVEGAELNVLKGMSEALRRDRPYILIEMQNEETQGSSPADVFNYLLSLGYRCWQIADKAEDRREIRAGETWTAHNLLFHVGDLPASLKTPWNWKSALRWSRGV